MVHRVRQDIGGTLEIDGAALRWSVRSMPQSGTADGNVGLRLTVVSTDGKTRRELILEYAFEKRQGRGGRIPEPSRIDPDALASDVRQAIDAGWEPLSRGRPFIFQMFEEDA